MQAISQVVFEQFLRMRQCKIGTNQKGMVYKELTENIFWIVLVYLLLMNMIGLLIMGIDKLKAKRHAWRIPEKALFLVSVLGGSVGTWAGMYLFRHKTKHWYFVVGMPTILVVHIVIFGLVFRLLDGWNR